MRTFALLMVLLAALVFCTVPSNSRATNSKRRATVRLVEPIILKGIVLQKGEYLFVHDDAAMQRGEACTFVYKGNSPIKENLITSFHCIPEQRSKANNFVIRTAQNKSGSIELREYQFSGETEAHLVPKD